jgi:hypothetical protein
VPIATAEEIQDQADGYAVTAQAATGQATQALQTQIDLFLADQPKGGTAEMRTHLDAVVAAAPALTAALGDAPQVTVTVQGVANRGHRAKPGLAADTLTVTIHRVGDEPEPALDKRVRRRLERELAGADGAEADGLSAALRILEEEADKS